MLWRAVAVVAAAFTAVVSLSATTLPAAAAVPQVTVEITGVEVTGTRPSDEVIVTGRVSNPTGAEVYGLVMAMWRSRDPIGDLAALRQVTGPATPPGVILPGGKGQEDSYFPITASNVAFAPGAVVAFTVRGTLADLGFDTLGKAYLVGARAVGTAAGSTAFGRVGQGSTVIALPGQPIGVTRLVMLSATPTKLATDVFRNDDLATELTGRLNVLLAAAAAPGMSWLIDPALIDEVTDLSDGYQVQSADGLREGSGHQIASAWLRRFNQLDPAAGARSMFGNPDLAGGAGAGDQEVLARARTAGNLVTSLRSLPLVVWPTGGSYTEAVDAYLAGDAPLLATNPLAAGVHQVAATGRAVLASAVTLPADPTDFGARQLALAETVLAGEAGQLRVLREPADLVADRAITTDWQQPRLLDEVPAGDPRPGEFAPAAPATLLPEQFAAVADLEKSVAAYRQLAPDSVIPDEAPSLLSRAVAQAWIGQDAAHTALVKDMDQLIGPAALKNAVTLDASPRFVMSARTSQFPLTVTNHLSEPIRVKVRTEADNPQRLRIPDSEVFTVAPGQSASITIRPEASANGVAIAEAWVATEDGSRVSPSIEITVEMTELGFVGWVIVLASGSVVLGATALRIWQVRRKSAGSPPPAPAPDAERSPSHRAPGPREKRSTATGALDEPGAPRE